jgi:hypothetical protein
MCHHNDEGHWTADVLQGAVLLISVAALVYAWVYIFIN